MELKKSLEQYGLSGKKSEVYIATLELGTSTVIDIAKKSKVKRTTCYDILLDLIDKGWVSETIKGKKRLFVGEDPENIQKNLKLKEKLFSDILPQLKSIYNTRGIKPKIRFYEGKDGLKEVYADTLRYGGELLAFASEDVAGVLGDEWVKDYLKARTKKGIKVRAIMPRSRYISSEVAAYDPNQLRKSKLIDPDKYPFSIEINIYAFQKIALMSSKEEMGVIIEGAEIYKTMKLIFELIWDTLPAPEI